MACTRGCTCCSSWRSRPTRSHDRDVRRRTVPTLAALRGYTYSAHPLACAAALATLDVHQELDLPGRAARIAPLWESAAHALREAPHVADIRNIGLLGAIDLQPRPGAAGARGNECQLACLQAGVLIRDSGDTLVLSPPLVISETQIAQVFGTIRQALERLA